MAAALRQRESKLLNLKEMRILSPVISENLCVCSSVTPPSPFLVPKTASLNFGSPPESPRFSFLSRFLAFSTAGEAKNRAPLGGSVPLFSLMVGVGVGLEVSLHC